MKAKDLWHNSTQTDIKYTLQNPLIKIILLSFDAFAEENYSEALNYMAEDVKFYISAPAQHPIGGWFSGKQEVLQFLKSRRKILQTTKLEFDKTIVQNNMVFILGYEEATVMPNNKVHKTELGLFFIFKEEKIQKFYRFFDSADMIGYIGSSNPLT